MEFDEFKLEMDTEKEFLLLQNSLKFLGKDERICLQLFYENNMTYAEIAHRIGHGPLQVKHFIQRGTNQLKSKMGAAGHA